MKFITIIGLALGLALGAVTQASATSPDVCKKSGGSYVCDPGGDKTYTYNTATSAAHAEAMLNAFLNNQQSQDQSQAQGQQQGQVATNINGGNNVSIKGGNVYNAPAPSASATGWCFTLPSGGVCVPMKSVQIALRQDLLDRCEQKTGKWYTACMVNAANSPQLRRAMIEAGLAN